MGGDWSSRLCAILALETTCKLGRIDVDTWNELTLGACRTRCGDSINWAALLRTANNRALIKVLARSIDTVPRSTHMWALLRAVTEDNVQLLVDTLLRCPRALHCHYFRQCSYESNRRPLSQGCSYFFTSPLEMTSTCFIGACLDDPKFVRCHESGSSAAMEMFVFHGYNRDPVVLSCFYEFAQTMLKEGVPYSNIKLRPDVRPVHVCALLDMTHSQSAAGD